MLSSKIFIVWLMALHVAYSRSAPSANKALEKTLVKQFNFQNQTVLLDPRASYNETHLVYGLCGDSDTENICKLTLDSLQNTGTPLSCDVKVNVSKKNIALQENVTVALLLYDRALVVAREGQKTKLTNVNFHGCSTSEAELDIDPEQEVDQELVNVVPYDSSYDVFFANSKLCQKRFCRITFDNDGKILKDAEAWGDDLEPSAILAVDHHSSAKGFIVHNETPSGGPRVSVVNNEGKSLLSVTSDNEDSFVSISVGGNNIGTCLNTLGSIETLECKQFDLEGKLVKTELQLNASSLVGPGEMLATARLNLAEGFLLATNPEFSVFHFDGNGKLLKAIKINDFECEEGLVSYPPVVFQNDAGHKCVYFKCTRDSPVHKLNVGVRCFTDDEL